MRDLPDKYNWPPVKAAYISEEVSYRELARRFGIPYSSVFARGKKEDWGRLRRERQEKLTAEMVDSAREKALKEGMKALAAMQTSSSNLMASIQRITEEVEPTIYTGDSRALSDLAKAMKDLTTVIRNVYGLPTVQEEESMRIAGERLKMEQKKAEAGGDPPEVIIRIEGEEEFAE